MEGEAALSPEAGFWRRPSGWVWAVFCLALGIFLASMVTWHEGRRFVARRLTPQETRIVMQALAVWESMPVQERDGDVVLLRRMLLEGRLLAMEASTFERPEERGTFGYTDERGRILLNPNLCFANGRMCGSLKPDGCDVVATLCTLYHETRHLIGQAGESLAYEQEWLFARRTLVWADERGQTALVEDLAEWEREMPTRIRLYLGREALEEIQLRLEPTLSQR